MRGIKFLFLTSLLCLPTSQALAQRSLGVGYGTVGTEIYGSVAIASWADIIIGHQSLDYDTDYHDDDRNTFEIEAEIDALKYGLKLHLFGDYGPSLELGMFSDAPTINVNAIADANAQFKVGSAYYNTSDIGTLTGTVAFDGGAAPYLLLGLGRTTASGIGFDFSLGVISYGAPKAKLVNSQCQLGSTEAERTALCDALQANIEKEQEKVNKDLEEYEYWPVARIGLSYGF